MSRRTLTFPGPAGSHPDSAAWAVTPAKTLAMPPAPPTYDGVTLDGQGNLTFTAQRAASGIYPNLRTDSAFTVQAPFAVEFDAQVPTASGTWPGLFLVEDKPPVGVTPGEIDVLECLGRRPDWVMSTIISRNAAGAKVDTNWNNAQTKIPGLAAGFHRFKVVVDSVSGFIEFYIDNHSTYTFTREDLEAMGLTWVFDRPMRLAMTLVVNPDKAGVPNPADYPQAMLIRQITTAEF